MESDNPLAARARETTVDQTLLLPARASRTGFDAVTLFAQHTMAARIWFLLALAAVAAALVEPWILMRGYKTRERVIVLDGAGTFAISPVLGFEEARELHESSALWATLALLQRNPQDFDFPETLQRLFLTKAYQHAKTDLEKTRAEFAAKELHQKPEVFKIDVLRIADDRLLVRVQGQLIRTGVFEGQAFTEAPPFTLNLTLARNPDMLANKRYPLAVWTYEITGA